jgi:hypothetical protein
VLTPTTAKFWHGLLGEVSRTFSKKNRELLAMIAVTRGGATGGSFFGIWKPDATFSDQCTGGPAPGDDLSSAIQSLRSSPSWICGTTAIFAPWDGMPETAGALSIYAG